MLIVGDDEQRWFDVMMDSSRSCCDRGACAVNKVRMIGDDVLSYLARDILIY